MIKGNRYSQPQTTATSPAKHSAHLYKNITPCTQKKQTATRLIYHSKKTKVRKYKTKITLHSKQFFSGLYYIAKKAKDRWDFKPQVASLKYNELLVDLRIMIVAVLSEKFPGVPKNVTGRAKSTFYTGYAHVPLENFRAGMINLSFHETALDGNGTSTFFTGWKLFPPFPRVWPPQFYRVNTTIKKALVSSTCYHTFYQTRKHTVHKQTNIQQRCAPQHWTDNKTKIQNDCVSLFQRFFEGQVSSPTRKRRGLLIRTYTCTWLRSWPRVQSTENVNPERKKKACKCEPNQIKKSQHTTGTVRRDRFASNARRVLIHLGTQDSPRLLLHLSSSSNIPLL